MKILIEKIDKNTILTTVILERLKNKIPKEISLSLEEIKIIKNN